MILGLLVGWSSEASVYKEPSSNSRKDSRPKISSNIETVKTYTSSEPFYMSTPQPPTQQRELPKNPYADYVDYYSRS